MKCTAVYHCHFICILQTKHDMFSEDYYVYVCFSYIVRHWLIKDLKIQMTAFERALKSSFKVNSFRLSSDQPQGTGSAYFFVQSEALVLIWFNCGSELVITPTFFGSYSLYDV